MKYLFFCFILIMGVNLAIAQSGDFNTSTMKYGQFVEFNSARDLGMGGSGLAGADAFSALYYNPALIFGQQKRLGLQVGVRMKKDIEDRSYPYYDSFAGFNDYGTYVYNSTWYNDFYGTIVIRPGLKKLTLAAGYYPFLDFNYNYHEEVRDPVNKSDKLLGYNTIENKGTLNSIPVAAAYEIVPNLIVGTQMAALFGSVTKDVIIDPKTTDFQHIARNETYERTLKQTPLLFSLGLHYKLNQRAAFGVKARLPFRLSFTQTVRNNIGDSIAMVTTSRITYPLRFAGGMEYRFKNVLEARINLDFTYDFWSQADNDPSLNFRDTYTFNLGVEHLFYNYIPLRIGFLYGTMRESADFSRSALTLGSGFNVMGAQINMAGGLSTLEYYQDDLFPNSLYNFPDRTDKDRVKLTHFFLRLDVRYALNF